LQPRPPGRKGTRAGTDDAESEGDRAASTGVVAAWDRTWDGGAPGSEREKRARSRPRPTPWRRARCASASLPEIERGEGDQGGGEQEDRVHCLLLEQSSSLLLIVE
jgi:hypothetical protein